ncbi:MAG: DUF3095 family protein [Candidatus Riflebacteria bacterium]|nr:DUF3095 family protein [Candidatus Riflebacteria bacterium]
MSDEFYESIQPFIKFSELTDGRHFRAVPENWFVILTDIIGSTQAIENGRYKDVNRVGAAAIVCAQKAMGGRDFPFVFGGDGATFLIPPERVEAVCRELGGLKNLSEKRFDLDLRVGKIAISEVLNSGARIEVARFELSGGRAIAIFRGGGIAAAEKMIKRDESRYRVEAVDGWADLDELSCRWKPIPASRGVSVSLLVSARSGDQATTYDKVLAGLESIVPHGLDAANPIQHSSMHYRGWWECVCDEARHFPTIWCKPFFAKLLGITVAVFSLGWGINLRFFDPLAYSTSIPAHCDYRKFDDSLRMILDCEPQQVVKLRAYLEGLFKMGEIFYGIHESGEALMTCFVRSTNPGDHIHFVDGAGGGYAMAAKQLKAQIKAIK